MKTEGIRALIHPAEKFVDEMAKKYADAATLYAEMEKYMKEVVDKVNRTCCLTSAFQKSPWCPSHLK